MGDPTITALLEESCALSGAALHNALSEQILPELRARAQAAMAREPGDHTLQPTALVNEVYVRMVDQNRVSWMGQTHFLSVAVDVLRRVLVDHARRRRAQKRGGNWQRVVWADAKDDRPAVLVDLLDLERALGDLQELDPRAARGVELRFFGNLTDSQIAACLDVSERTVRGDWAHARAWLRGQLKDGLT